MLLLVNCFGFEVPTAVTLKSFPTAFAGFLFGLFFCPENGVDMFPRNVWLSTNYTALQHMRPYSFITDFHVYKYE
jgi:hypothetical protein